MSPTDERLMAHALAVRARGSTLPPEGTPPPAILDSWVRCMRNGLDLGAPLSVPVVEAPDLAQRRDRSVFVRRLALAQLETLSQQIAGSNFLLAFADRDGVILDLFTDNRFSMSGSDAGIVAGSCWREDLCGTNGLGTALTEGQAVAVTGLEHYFLKLGDISCTAAPVRDAGGEVVGVLDASSYFASRQQHTLALVQMAATQIENGLLVHQMRAHIVLAIHPRAEYLGTLSAGLMAFDGQGRVMAANARARRLLAGLDAAPGTSFDELFGEPFEHLLARLHIGHEVRLRDVLGSSLVASVVCRPPPRRTKLPALPTLPSLAQGETRVVDAATAMHSAADVDPALAEARRLVGAAVRMKVPILIQGETGSGKELLARHAHEASGRGGEFVAVNCGAVPDDLFEAELFGHVGGAYTGARREGGIGLIASADGGTLLLDEVRELHPALQAVLLRFLDDGLVRPVGGTVARRVDVQLLAASNVDLKAEVAARRFREDLFFRLNTVTVTLPPLRARRDFAAAVQATLASLDAQATVTPRAIERLAQHGWPGNFRELRSVLTRALLVAGGPEPRRLDHEAIDRLLPAPTGQAASLLQKGATELVLREFERNGRSVSRTSRSLGISRTTVYRHLRESGRRPD